MAADDDDQVAYLMADISDANATVIKDIYQQLESLSCVFTYLEKFFWITNGRQRVS